MELYLPGKVEKFLGIKKHTLTNWRKLGFVRPTIFAPGQGGRSYFSKYDVIRIKIFMNLIGSGIRRKQACEISNQISDMDIDAKNFVVFIKQKTWDRLKYDYRIGTIEGLADYLSRNPFDEYHILNLRGYLQNLKIDIESDY